jgi:hypothetical protein
MDGIPEHAHGVAIVHVLEGQIVSWSRVNCGCLGSVGAARSFVSLLVFDAFFENAPEVAIANSASILPLILQNIAPERPHST